MRKWIATLLMLALVAIPAWAEGESGILDIENIFLYETAVEGDQNPEKSLAANAAYRAKLASLVEKLDDVYETETLSFHTKQALAVDDFTALTWQVTNRTDKTLFVDGSDFDVDFEGVEYDLCGGRNQYKYLLAPGETVDARFHGVPFGHFDPGEGTLRQKLTVYALTEEGLQKAEKARREGGNELDFNPEDGDGEVLEKVTFAVPLTMKKGETRSALKDGQPLVVPMDGYELRVSQAEMSEVAMRLKLERVYPTKEAAEADPGVGEKYWAYSLVAVDGTTWIQAYYGMISDNAEENPDGTWSWHYEGQVYYMFSQPDEVWLRSRDFTGSGYDDSTIEDVKLTFSEEKAD